MFLLRFLDGLDSFSSVLLWQPSHSQSLTPLLRYLLIENLKNNKLYYSYQFKFNLYLLGFKLDTNDRDVQVATYWPDLSSSTCKEEGL